MNGNYYISNDDYNIFRNGLLDNNNNIIKTSIQSLITQLEENKVLNSKCTKDLCAILYKVVQHSDYKIRKWAYHLIAYKNTPDLILRCIKNLTDGLENDNENITWIMAIASTKLEEDELYILYRKYAEQKINKLQYRLCTAIFSPYGLRFTQRDVRKILTKEDFLSKMWLTKIYACVYKEAKKKQYVKVVNHKIMNELLLEDKLRRYALWSFSTFAKTNIRKIDIKPYNVEKLDSKSQAWYYNCMFKDKNYVYKNRDHVELVLDDFISVPTVVQGGILRGLENIEYNLDYMESKLVRIYCGLDEESVEDIPLLISLTQIFLKHNNESDELKRVLADVKSNTKIEAIKRMLLFYNNKKEDGNMARTFIFNGPSQYNEKPENVTQVNAVKGNFDNGVVEIDSEIQGILEKLKEGCYDNVIDADNTEFSNMITNFEYELSLGKNLDVVKETLSIKEKLNELEMSVNNLKNGKLSERKAKFSNVLTKISEVCTVIMASPQLVDITQNIMLHIKNFLNI